MDTNTILKARDIQDLKSLGFYLEVKRSFEEELDNKLGSYTKLFTGSLFFEHLSLAADLGVRSFHDQVSILDTRGCRPPLIEVLQYL